MVDETTLRLNPEGWEWVGNRKIGDVVVVVMAGRLYCQLLVDGRVNQWSWARRAVRGIWAGSKRIRMGRRNSGSMVVAPRDKGSYSLVGKNAKTKSVIVLDCT